MIVVTYAYLNLGNLFFNPNSQQRRLDSLIGIAIIWASADPANPKSIRGSSTKEFVPLAFFVSFQNDH